MSTEDGGPYVQDIPGIMQMIGFPNIMVDRPVGILNRGALSSTEDAPGRTCRLLYLVGQLGLGGLERQLCYLLRAIDRARYRPAVAVWNFSPDDINVHETRTLGVPIYFFPSGVSRVVKLRGFRHLARLLDPEVIHSYSFYTNFAAYWAALGTKAVAMGSLREDFTHAQKRGGLWRGRLNARWPRYQIYNSLSSAEKARRATDIFSPKHIDIVRNGVDLQRFGGFEGSPVSRAYIVGIGSLQPLKRWDRLLRIVHQLKNKRADCWIRIAGDGPERMSLEKQAQDLGISQCVEFIGPTLDVPGLLEKSRFLVHTSDTEGCPNVVMEAMASGRAVVAMEAGDIRFLVEDGKTGFVVRCGDETAFAERVLQLLSDDELCRRMGLAARAKAEREFGLGLLVSETLNAYRAAGWKG